MIYIQVPVTSHESLIKKKNNSNQIELIPSQQRVKYPLAISHLPCKNNSLKTLRMCPWQIIEVYAIKVWQIWFEAGITLYQ